MNANDQKVILIVEDEEEIRAFYSDIFEEAGYSVLGASTGTEGLNLVKDSIWHILLLDIMLPDHDGMYILEELNSHPEFKKGPVVMLTNLNSEPVIKESFSLGADGYLVKAEISPDKMVTEVEQFLTLPQ